MKPSLSLELSVCAVIVTYHPNAGMLENMAKVLTQVQDLVVVDNGSTAEELAPLREASKAWRLPPDRKWR